MQEKKAKNLPSAEPSFTRARDFWGAHPPGVLAMPPSPPRTFRINARRFEARRIAIPSPLQVTNNWAIARKNRKRENACGFRKILILPAEARLETKVLHCLRRDPF